MSFEYQRLSDTVQRQKTSQQPSAAVLTDRQLAINQWHSQMQADRIMDYWHTKGHREVRAWVQYVRNDGYQVRSNLIRGLPPSNDHAIGQSHAQ